MGNQGIYCISAMSDVRAGQVCGGDSHTVCKTEEEKYLVEGLAGFIQNACSSSAVAFMHKCP